MEFGRKKVRQLAGLISTILVVLFATITAAVSIRFWWASLPTSGMAIAAAVFIFKKGFYDPGKEE